jgi:hypothetical protein
MGSSWVVDGLEIGTGLDFLRQENQTEAKSLSFPGGYRVSANFNL